MSNSFDVIGRVVKDGEERHTTTGKLVVKFTVAENVYVKGVKRDPHYWDVELWEKQAEYWFPLIKKGQILSLAGTMKQSRITPKGSEYEVTRYILTPNKVVAFDHFVIPKSKTADAEPEITEDPSPF